MTDPMTRIADALELIAVVQSRDSDGYAANSLRERILARHSVPTVTAPVLPTTDASNAPPPETAAPLCSFGCGRPATETANGEPVCGDGDACIAAIPLKPAPQTVDVLGSELRVGDVVVGAIEKSIFVAYHRRWQVRHLSMGLALDGGDLGCAVPVETTLTYRVRLPRPAVEPSADAKCPTCRCMITPGSECACCVSTSGEYPPLPSLDLDDAEPSADEDTKRRDPGCECVLEEGDSDCPVHPSDPETGEPIGDWHRPITPTSRAGESDETSAKRNAIAKALRDVYFDRTSSILSDPLSWRMAQAILDLPWEEPSASGEGIARSDHLCITVAYGAGSYTWTAHNEGEASTIEAAINAAHVNATRELRARCERAERDRDEVRASLFSCATLRAEYQRERDAAIARAEAAEQVVEAARCVLGEPRASVRVEALRARIAAAVTECERIESDAERRGSYADELDTAVCAATQDVARAVRAKLEGR